MDIKNFITFKKIVEEGSFSKASEKLKYAQSTVSSHIQAIETYYDKALFDRIGKRVQLTQFGKEILEYTNKLLETYDSMISIVNKENTVKGHIRIGAPESLMMHRLYKIIIEYKKLYPQVEINIISDACPNLNRKTILGELDLSIILQPILEYNQLKVLPLKHEKFCLIAPKGHTGDKLIPKDNQMVLWPEQECTYGEVFRSYLRENKFYPNNVLQTSSVEAIKKYVIDGLGVSYVPFYSVEREIEDQLLTAIEWKSDISFHSQIVYHKNKWLNPALSELINIIIERSLNWK